MVHSSTSNAMRERNRLYQQRRRQQMSSTERDISRQRATQDERLMRIQNMNQAQTNIRLEHRRVIQQSRRSQNRDSSQGSHSNNNENVRINNVHTSPLHFGQPSNAGDVGNMPQRQAMQTSSVGSTSTRIVHEGDPLQENVTCHRHVRDSPPQINNNNVTRVLNGNSGIQRREPLPFHNIARSFRETRVNISYRLPPPTTCAHCHARLFHGETAQICCLNGAVKLPPLSSPPEMLELYRAQTPEGRHFRQYIRVYNNAFAFTSMGVHYDQNLAGGSEGVYTFRAQGAIYHRIGSLIPMPNQRTRYAQSYIVDTDLEIENRLLENDVLHRNLIVKIRNILQGCANPFVQVFKQVGQLEDLPTCKLLIKPQAANMHQYSLPTASQVAVVIVDGEAIGQLNPREIVVQTVGGTLMNVPDTAGYYDPLHYVILLPYGSYGWDVNSQNVNGGRVTCRTFYAYMLQIRPNDKSLLLLAGRLLQQYVVDNYAKIETHRLRWFRDNQHTIRVDFCQGLQDYFSTGENDADNVGKKSIVLPSSFPGSHRDQHQRYQDSMALVHRFGMPDLMITITCNPNWPEIKNELLPGQSPQDRPDLLARIFRAKMEEIKKDILKRGVLGMVISYSYVIEFQKRGLPHCHMLVIFVESDKLRNPADFDRVVRAEIPSKQEELLLHQVVLKHMIHGPHGTNDRHYPCIKDGKCKKRFPKEFCNETRRGHDSYPIYQRRPGPPVPLDSNNRKFVDNGWVVPYNPWLLLKYDCHINVEVTSNISCAKYLYKYVYKGADRIMMEVRSDKNNEINQFVDGRWICAPEALWHIYGFKMSRMYPSVYRLSIHLPNMQVVRYTHDQRVGDILENANNSKTMLIEFFKKNTEPHLTGRYLYHEFPAYFVWNEQQKVWTEREGHNKVIGRIYTVSPYQGDLFFARILLNHVRGHTSFEDLRTVNGVVCATFKAAAERRGILEHDDYVRDTLTEASRVCMAPALRRLFVSLLITCQPARVCQLWEEFCGVMMEDYALQGNGNNTIALNRLIGDIGAMLDRHGRKLNDYDLLNSSEGFESIHTIPRLIMDEMSVPISDVDVNSVGNLNPDQLCAYKVIMEATEKGHSRIFFIDGPGGTGKTYLYKALLANIRRSGKIAIAVASSGIAATGLPGGRTAHSRFKIPLKPDAGSSCRIKLEDDDAELMRWVKVIVWDEAPMTNKYAFEALDKTLKDIMKNEEPFGGKIVILGGDFRQVLPIVKKGNRCQQVDASIRKSNFWSGVEILRLKHNMRSLNDNSFSEFLLRVGDGREPTLQGDLIKLPPTMVLAWESEESLNTLIDATFPNMSDHMFDSNYMVTRAIITPKNADVDKLNKMIIEKFPGDVQEYTSWDSVVDDVHNLYQPEFLNSLCPSGLPPNKLILKVGCPVMLLRNLDPQMGLCNGTRLICRNLRPNFIDAEIITGNCCGTRVFLHRMSLNSEDDSGLPFVMKRIQFPVRVSFALTINKAQGQTIPNVGIFLRNHVFGHGQLYVSLSRGVSESTTKILVKNGKIPRRQGVFTMNVVYKEVLLPPT